MTERYNLNLFRKRILVTGAGGYLGSEIAFGLSLLGAHVILNGREQAKLKDLCRRIEDAKGSAEIASFNVTNEREAEIFFQGIDDMGLDGLVNNAYAGSSGSILTSNAEDFRSSYEVGVVAPATLMRLAYTHLRKTKNPSIVNIASMYGIVAPHLEVYGDLQFANPPFYGAAKAALIQLTRYAAVEFGQYGIRVNSVTPGAFPSDKAQASNPQLMKELKLLNPLRRLGEPSEIVGIVAYLLSDLSTYTTGANFVVDGGWTSW